MRPSACASNHVRHTRKPFPDLASLRNNTCHQLSGHMTAIASLSLHIMSIGMIPVHQRYDPRALLVSEHWTLLRDPLVICAEQILLHSPGLWSLVFTKHNKSCLSELDQNNKRIQAQFKPTVTTCPTWTRFKNRMSEVPHIPDRCPPTGSSCPLE